MTPSPSLPSSPSPSPSPSTSQSPSSPAPVDVVLIGRTLRGTLGEAFRAEAVALFESAHPDTAPVQTAPPHTAPAHTAPVHTALSRTVELTVVAITRAGPLSVDAVIADPAFGQRMPTAAPAPGRQLFEVVAESVEGITPVGGPDGIDRTRRILVSVDSEESLAFTVRVVSRD